MVWIIILPKNIWIWETIHAWNDSQFSEGWCSFKNAAVRDAVWYPLLSPQWTWMDVKTLWLFLFCKEVDTVASWNFHIILWLLRFFRYLYNYNFAYKSAWWQKPMKTEIENTEPNVSSMDMAYRTTWSRVYGKMIIT